MNSHGVNTLISIYAGQATYRIFCLHWGGEGDVLRSLANKCEQDYDLSLNLIVKRLQELRGFTWKKERWWKRGWGTVLAPLQVTRADDVERAFILFSAPLESRV